MNPKKTHIPLQQRLTLSAEEFRTALSDVIDQVPVPVKKPAEFKRVLRLDRNLSSRVLRAVSLGDPLATLRRMPGLSGVRQLLRAAANAGVDRVAIAKAEHALSALEGVVTAEVGTWQDLIAALSGWLPDARAEFERTNRQTAFRAIRNIRGLAADAEISTKIIFPSATTPGWLDRVTITGVCNLRRLREGVPFAWPQGRLSTPIPDRRERPNQVRVTAWGSITPLPDACRAYSLDGELIEADPGMGLLSAFSSVSGEKIELHRVGELTRYTMESDLLGYASRADLFLANAMLCRYPRHQTDRIKMVTPGAIGENVPVRVLIIDVFLHKDVWTDVTPELRSFDTAGRGAVSPADPNSEIYRRDPLEPVQDLGNRLEGFRIKEVGRYVEMLRFVCDKMHWDPKDLRGYRCRIEYPLFATQYNLVFRLPPAEGAGEGIAP